MLIFVYIVNKDKQEQIVNQPNIVMVSIDSSDGPKTR